MYDGGIRVPGILEWPGKIARGTKSDVNTVTSDILPTLCRISGLDEPDRPLDGIDLTSLIEGRMVKRTVPIFFWSFNTAEETKRTPYLPLELQTGTTPLVKMMNGLYTRNFQNFHHGQITQTDYSGQRVILEKQYKLVIIDQSEGRATKELFDVRSDPTEKNNLVDSKPSLAGEMELRLRVWQKSVLTSLTGADYLR